MYFKTLFLFFFLVTIAPASYAADAVPYKLKNTRPVEDQAADLSIHGYMRQHFRAGMKRFFAGDYQKAIPELLAATMITDPFIGNYWYAEAYANLGVIYEFYDQSPDHRQKAYEYYALALKRDPQTFTARYYIRRVKLHAPKNQKGE